MRSAVKRHWSIASILILAASGSIDSPSAAPRAPAPDLTLSAALAANPDEQRGKQLFEQRCAECHRQDAQGLAARQIPALAGQQYEYLVKQLVDFIDFERASETMHAALKQRNVRDAQSIADIVGYVANLRMNPAPEKGRGDSLELGEQIFSRYCASCHGKTAEGNADLWIPNLRGQHYGYLVKQLQFMAQRRRNNISEDLHWMFTTYADTEFEAVADFLTRTSAR